MNKRQYSKRIKALEHSQKIRLHLIKVQAEQVAKSVAQFKELERLTKEVVRQRDEAEKKVLFLRGVLEERNNG